MVPDRSITLMLFYAVSDRVFYAIPEMTYLLRVGPKDTKAPFGRALVDWAGLFKGADGLVGYLSHACWYVNKMQTIHRSDLMGLIGETDSIDVYMHTDSREPHVIIGGRVPGKLATGPRPDSHLLASSPCLR